MSKNLIQKRPFNFNIHILCSWDRWVIDTISRTYGAWCVGGAPLALYINKPNQVNDWDIFVENSLVKDTIEYELQKFGFQLINTDGYLAQWDKGITNPCKVQVITKYSINNHDFVDKEFINRVFEGFDISICRVGFYNTNNFYIVNDAIDDISKGVFNLRFHTSKTEMRIKKYKNKGFIFNESSFKTAKKAEATY